MMNEVKTWKMKQLLPFPSSTLYSKKAKLKRVVEDEKVVSHSIGNSTEKVISSI